MVLFFAIVSNLVFLFPASVALRRHFYLAGFVYLGVVIFSSLYHTCDDYVGTCIIGSFITQSSFDFFFAIFTIPMSSLVWIDWGKYLGLKYLILFTYATVIAVMQAIGIYSNVVLAIIAASSFIILGIYWIICFRKNCFPKYDWFYSLAGSGFTYMGVAFFLFQDNSWQTYDPFHGTWHITSAIGQGFFILSTYPFVQEQDKRMREHPFNSLPIRHKFPQII